LTSDLLKSEPAVETKSANKGEIAGLFMDSLSLTNNLPLHFAFALLAASYFFTKIFWARVLAVLGLIVALLYARTQGMTGNAIYGWGLLLILINLYQLLWLVKERHSLRLPEKDKTLLREALSGLDDTQIARLLKAAEWKDCVTGDILTRQDAPVDALYFLCSGRVNVEVDKSFVTYLEKGAFIGEIAYLTGNPATARVTVDEPSRLLMFSKMKMARVAASDEQISGILYQLLGRDLAMKMRRSNTRRVLVDDDPTRF
jgi:CRP-like cAMP-binding protein